MNFKHVVTYVIGLMTLTATAANAGAQIVSEIDGLGGHEIVETHKVIHRVTAEVRPVVNMLTHGFYRGYNDMGKAVPYAASAHLKYSFSLNPKSRLGQLYPTAYQGVGVAVHSFFNHDLTGTPVIMYLFQGSRLADLSPNISFDYEWNLGASYGWKVNEVVGSRWNIYINVGLPFTWHVNPKCDISFGPEYTHFSNGDTTFPNGGANTVGLRLGVTWKNTTNGSTLSSKSSGSGMDMSNHREGSHTTNNSLNTMKAPGRLLIQREPELQKLRAAKRMSYDLFIYGAWRADRYIHEGKLQIINEPHAVAGITFNPLYRLNRYISVGPGVDIMMDRSADLGVLAKTLTNTNPTENTQKATLPLTNQTACGVSAKAELTMPYFSINLGIGYNILTKANDLKGFYTTYNLKAFLSQKLFLTMGYRLGSVNYAHNLMFGVGVRL